MDWWKHQNFINTLKKLDLNELLSMQTCQKFVSPQKWKQAIDQYNDVASHMLRLSGHTVSSHTAMLQPLKLGRVLCGLCKDTVNSSDNVALNCWGVGKRCEGRGGGLIWGITPIRTCLKEPNTTTKTWIKTDLWNQIQIRDLRNTKQGRDIWWYHRLVIVTTGRSTKKEN
jgi:hypothetical protein